MRYNITAPRRLDTTINLPASKSVSNRALIIRAISGSNIVPRNLSDCDDTEVIVSALAFMPREIDIKAAGTAMRFMTAFLAIKDGDEHVLTGTERMKRRPIRVLVAALRYLGADISYGGEEGFPPLIIKGKHVTGGHLEVQSDVSSQYISALLMIGPVLRDGIELKLNGEIASRPYIELTLWMMREFGAEAEWTDVDIIKVQPKPYTMRDFLVENDWTAAAYWYETLALNADNDSTVRLAGLMDGSKQGDSAVRYVFSLLDIRTSFESRHPGTPTTVTLRRHTSTIPRLDYDFINTPDLAQPVAVACALKDIPFHFTGLNLLKIKETDRMAALEAEMRKLGFVLRERDDSELIWDGERCEATFEPIDTYEDHRMAMAFAPAAMMFPGLEINNPQVVTKSYPHFWDDLREAGFTITG